MMEESNSFSNSTNSDSILINIKPPSEDNEKDEINRSEIKSILRKTYSTSKEDQKKMSEIINKTLITLFIVLCALPIIVCDLYYAYNDTSCVNDYANKIIINLKTYLILSSFNTILAIILIIFGMCMTSYKYSNFINTSIIIIPLIIIVICALFNIVWNIIGSIIFWGGIYKTNNCDNYITTYMFVSLIIKLFMNLIAILILKNKKNKLI